MNNDQLIKFITDNQTNDLKDFYDKSHAKLQDLNKRVDKTTLYLIVVVLIYFLLAKSSIESFAIGPFNVKDISAIGQLLPVVFSYLLFDLVICSNHKSEVYMTVKFLFLTLYQQKIELSDLHKNKNNLFTRILLPFSFTTELSRLTVGRTPIVMALIGIVLALPTFAFYILPFVAEYYMLVGLLDSQFDAIGKISFYATIYINMLLIFYFLKVAINNHQDLQAERLPNME